MTLTAAQKLLEEENVKLRDELRQSSLQLAQSTTKSRQLLETVVSQQQFLVDIGDRLREVEKAKARDAGCASQLKSAERELAELKRERNALMQELHGFRQQHENVHDLKHVLNQRDKELAKCRQRVRDLEHHVRQLSEDSGLLSRLKAENSTLSHAIKELKADNEDLATAASKMVGPHKVTQLESRIVDLESLLAQSRKEADTLRTKCASEAEKQRTTTEDLKKRQQQLESENSSLRKQLTHATTKAQELNIVKSRCERMMNELTALREGKSMAENAAIAAAGLQERFAEIASERDMLQDRVITIGKERDMMQEKLRVALTRERELLEDMSKLTQQNMGLRREQQTRPRASDGTIDVSPRRTIKIPPPSSPPDRFRQSMPPPTNRKPPTTTSAPSRNTHTSGDQSSDQPTFIFELSNKVLDAFTAKIDQLETSFDELSKPTRRPH
ncbi:hypothetical protein HK097_006372 [Rhizophlyctis rosea]|uniref:Uncharacterized protein n=1 Tax=Rhizophlyctis rosea TaxID=64517 RepID=A0AAD5SS27_9FUNG|nr:hypothetical protein HK097_006372 [Rhizophlyctis rosea]